MAVKTTWISRKIQSILCSSTYIHIYNINAIRIAFSLEVRFIPIFVWCIIPPTSSPDSYIRRSTRLGLSVVYRPRTQPTCKHLYIYIDKHTEWRSGESGFACCIYLEILLLYDHMTRRTSRQLIIFRLQNDTRIICIRQYL